MKLIKLLFISLLGVILTACGGGEGGGLPSQDGGDNISGPTIVSLQITPAITTTPVGFDQQYTAFATLSDGTTKDVTNDSSLTWNSSDPNIATIVSGQTGGNGLAMSVAPGTVTITAAGTANGSAFSATAQLSITNAVVTALQVTPATTDVPVGFGLKYTAIATLSDGQTLDVTNQRALNWGSSDTTIAAIENTKGKKGIAKGLAVGTVTITASGTANNTPFASTAELSVTNAIVTALQITPLAESVPVGLEKRFTAEASFSDGSTRDVTNDAALSWTSSDERVATITTGLSIDNGVATGVIPGTITVTATGSANDKQFSATSTLTVTNATIVGLSISPYNRNVPVGFTRQYTATATLSDGSSLVVTTNAALSWRSSTPSIASIENAIVNKGQATGLIPGTATITAAGVANGVSFSASTPLTVTDATLIDVSVTPESTSIAEDATQQYVATGLFSDSTSDDISSSVSWHSDDINIATIDTTGLATGVMEGNTNISAVTSDIISNIANLNVSREHVVAWGPYPAADVTSLQSLLNPSNVLSISGTVGAFAALKKDGSVITWGGNTSGGDSSAVQAQLTNVTEITASDYHFAALKKDSSVVYWGGNSSAQPFPFPSGLTDVISVSASSDAYAALKTDGSVVTWGGSRADISAVQSQLTSDVASITASKSSFAALKTDGSVVTWGWSGGGGDSSSVASLLSSDVTSIYGNRLAFAAMKNDGSIVTWGNTLDGGDSSAVQPQLTNVKSISTGDCLAFAALKTDGSVVTWGHPERGGDSSSVSSQLNGVQSVVCNNNAFAALKTDGSVVTWGDAIGGADSSAVQSSLNNVIAIKATNSAFAALKADGTIVTWGDSSNGGDSSKVQSILTGVSILEASDVGSAFVAIR